MFDIKLLFHKKTSMNSPCSKDSVCKIEEALVGKCIYLVKSAFENEGLIPDSKTIHILKGFIDFDLEWTTALGDFTHKHIYVLYLNTGILLFRDINSSPLVQVRRDEVLATWWVSAGEHKRIIVEMHVVE